jgi:2-methylcitrate dehydratase PrpD
MSTVAERFASFSCTLTLDRIPAEVREAARLHLLDTLGCGLAAHALDVAPAARRAMTEDGVSGPATVIGHAGGLPPADAALANGSTAHALDFDDTHSGAIAHVSVAVVPAVLASAEAAGSSGADVVAALVAGNEIVIRLGMAAGPAFHARGFHPTAVCGIFGATAAVARLRGLDAATTVQALGIAGSMASGVLEHLADGSSTKRLHPGWAAHAAIIATRLAAHGATGPSTVIEGRFGLYRAYLGRDDVDIASHVADLGERWETPRIAFKPYPACHYIHASVDATAQILEQHSLRAEDIEGIVAVTNEAGVRLVLEPLAAKHRPRTEYDAKFSLPYSVASLIVRGVVDVGTYTDAALGDEEVLDLAGKVTYEVKDYATSAQAFPGGIRIRTRDGRTLEAELEYQRGAPENPMSADEVREKFRSNAVLALSAEDTRALEESVMGLEDHADLGALRILGKASIKEEVAA